MLDNKSAVVALGYFDSVHVGHRKVILEAKKYADEIKAKLIVITFGGNLKAFLHGEEIKSVYTEEERFKIYKELGVDEVYFAPVNMEFLSLSKIGFIEHINARYSVVAYYCGEDYRFGKNGSGDVNDLIAIAKEKDQRVFVVSLVEKDGQKVSTTRIKSLLAKGQIEEANLLLGREYSISGEVFRNRAVGRSIGFPTINVRLDADKQRLKDGVYYGAVEIDGVDKKAVVNYGARPTFNLDERLVEAHIIDFDGELYGQRVTIKFRKFMREIIKFGSLDELVRQLEADSRKVKEGFYD